MSAKKGIQNTKELMILGLQLGMTANLAYADGEISTADLGLVVQLFPHLMPAIKDIGEVPDELKDLDSAEADELMLEAAKFVPHITDNARLGLIIIKSVKVALAIGELVGAISEEEVVAAPTKQVEG